jgi:hypothetical protein
MVGYNRFIHSIKNNFSLGLTYLIDNPIMSITGEVSPEGEVMNTVQKTEGTNKALCLTLRVGSSVPLTVNPNDLIFTGSYMEVKNHSKEFDGEVKAVYTLPILGGAFLKPGRQPEEAFELAKRYPGKTFVCKSTAKMFQRKEVVI